VSPAPGLPDTPPPPERPSRVVIERVAPEVDAGRFAAKRIAGDRVKVRATIFADGHEVLAAEVLYRHDGPDEWSRAPMRLLGNDRWEGAFDVPEVGRYEYTVEAWVDRYATWLERLEKRLAAGQDLAVEFQVGARLLASAAGPGASGLGDAASWLPGLDPETGVVLAHAVSDEACRNQDKGAVAAYARVLAMDVERERAGFGAWYEFFPRSFGKEGEHGSLADAAEMLPYVRSMGFDVVYLPPIHPIGISNRKGPNDALAPGPAGPGSPWAIGSSHGGHCAVHPELGTLDDFRRFRVKAEELGLEVALDIAFQCSPDHPWVAEHPEWFEHLPDGSIRHAENPPKKYEDIVPFDFECEDWQALWEALRGVVTFWALQGVRIFRVDNPHTKPFTFWEWLIASVRDEYPDAIFLAEAFTRPAVLHHLAKLGFSQSYNYFAWRNTSEELTSYVNELLTEPGRDYLRPSFWPNTPDILTGYLQSGGRPAFMVRLVLAATLSGSYGIYGPAFELCEDRPREPGSEEYLDSEKYQLRQWDLANPWSLREFIARVNAIRHTSPAFRNDAEFRFHPVDNDRLLCYSRSLPDGGETVVVVVNLDPRFKQSGHLDLDPSVVRVEPGGMYQAHDLLGGGRYLWQGSRNYVELDPAITPAHIFLLRTERRTEREFEYFL
jgi:starch synthase (maltosyl-transferring)